MSSISSRFIAVTPVPAPAASPTYAFTAQLSALYALSQKNNHIFGSPLGPVYSGGRAVYLPRFVFFGPHATDESWRLAFLAGFDRRDLRAGQAVLRLVASLAENSEHGHGLNLTFFPLIDTAGARSDPDSRHLERAHWARSTAPEIDLLEKDARLRGYHGFIRVESTSEEDELIIVRVREPAGLLPSPDVELISSEETEPFPVRFERTAGSDIPDGPLTVADDLPVQPFELTLRIPTAWSDDLYHEAVRVILTRFILRYRAFQAYGQHL